VFAKTDFGYIRLDNIDRIAVEPLKGAIGEGNVDKYGIYLHKFNYGYFLMNDKIYDTKEDADEALAEFIENFNMLSMKLPL